VDEKVSGLFSMYDGKKTVGFRKGWMKKRMYSELIPRLKGCRKKVIPSPFGEGIFGEII